MDFAEFWKENYVVGSDAIHLIEVLELFNHTYGQNRCWCIKKIKTPEHIKGFVLTHTTIPIYKATDVRPLLLALLDQYQSDEKPIIVRRGCCKSKYCVNPTHYFYGTKRDVAFQLNIRNGSHLDEQLLEKLRREKKKDRSYASIARQFDLPYYTVRRALQA